MLPSMYCRRTTKACAARDPIIKQTRFTETRFTYWMKIEQRIFGIVDCGVLFLA